MKFQNKFKIEGLATTILSIFSWWTVNWQNGNEPILAFLPLIYSENIIEE